MLSTHLDAVSLSALVLMRHINAISAGLTPSGRYSALEEDQKYDLQRHM